MKKIITVMILAVCLLSGCSMYEIIQTNETHQPIEATITPNKPSATESAEKQNGKLIKSGAKKDPACSTVVYEYEGDIDLDGEDDSIVSYTSAEKEDGEIVWDDGQSWNVIATINGRSYELYSGYINVGQVSFNVYRDEQDEPVITLTKHATAEYSVKQYKLTADGLLETVVIEDTGVNMLTVSVGA